MNDVAESYSPLTQRPSRRLTVILLATLVVLLLNLGLTVYRVTHQPVTHVVPTVTLNGVPQHCEQTAPTVWNCHG